MCKRFGYRYLNWTPEGGFFLNGVATKFHEVSLHHDHGASELRKITG